MNIIQNQVEPLSDITAWTLVRAAYHIQKNSKTPQAMGAAVLGPFNEIMACANNSSGCAGCAVLNQVLLSATKRRIQAIAFTSQDGTSYQCDQCFAMLKDSAPLYIISSKCIYEMIKINGQTTKVPAGATITKQYLYTKKA